MAGPIRVSGHIRNGHYIRASSRSRSASGKWTSGGGGFRYRTIQASYPPGEIDALIRSRRGPINRVGRVTFYPPDQDRSLSEAYVDISRRARGTAKFSRDGWLYRGATGGTESRRYGNLTNASISRLYRITGG